jgi:hypothetical protein
MIQVELTPESREVIDRMASAGEKGVAALNRALLKITAWFLRESTKAFEDKRQPGGPAWAPNYGDEPGGYAWFKREILGLRGDSTGIINGELRNSMAQEVFAFPTLESRVGTPKPAGKPFSEGGTSGMFFVKAPNDKWWMFPGGPFPGRPFLPETSYAGERAAALLDYEMQRFSAELNGGSFAGAEG